MDLGQGAVELAGQPLEQRRGRLTGCVQADGHGDFTLPDRDDLRLLWINSREQFERDWYKAIEHAQQYEKTSNEPMGKVIAHFVKANLPPENGTGWHYHVADFQIVIMTKGWAKFMYEDKVTLVEAGDVVHQMPGIVHYLFDYSPDMEYLEIVGPADFGTVEVSVGPSEVPGVTPWK